MNPADQWCFTVNHDHNQEENKEVHVDEVDVLKRNIIHIVLQQSEDSPCIHHAEQHTSVPCSIYLPTAIALTASHMP